VKGVRLLRPAVHPQEGRRQILRASLYSTFLQSTFSPIAFLLLDIVLLNAQVNRSTRCAEAS
jgi:hypothetical protein